MQEGREIMFAGAGLLWGAVTLFRGIQIWRKSQSTQSIATCAVQVFPIGKLDLPTSIFGGCMMVIACMMYLIWHVCLY